MRRLALLAAAGLVAALAGPAHAAPEPTGPLCGFASVDDPTAENTATQTGAFFAGPLALGDNANPAVVYSGSITCTIQVDAPTHSGWDLAARTGPTTGVAAVLPYGQMDYPVGLASDVYICTQVDLVGGTTLYYDAAAADWSTNPASRCELAVRVGCDTILSGCIGLKEALIDPIVCPILRPFFPPEGDVGVFWDCPPYQTAPSGYATRGYFHVPTVHAG